MVFPTCCCSARDQCVCVFVCSYGLKVITPEETFTLLASSLMDKVNM